MICWLCVGRHGQSPVHVLWQSSVCSSGACRWQRVRWRGGLYLLLLYVAVTASDTRTDTWRQIISCSDSGVTVFLVASLQGCQQQVVVRVVLAWQTERRSRHTWHARLVDILASFSGVPARMSWGSYEETAVMEFRLYRASIVLRDKNSYVLFHAVVNPISRLPTMLVTLQCFIHIKYTSSWCRHITVL